MPASRRLPPGPPPRQRPELDEIDRTLVDLLRENARLPNSTLAARAGIAESTCSARVRSLVERGVVQRFTAVVDPSRLGLLVQAMVSVRLAGHDTVVVQQFGDEVAGLEGVQAVWNISGAEDFLVHVACPTPDALRDFVLTHLTSRPGVVHAHTSLIFRTHSDLPGGAGL